MLLTSFSFTHENNTVNSKQHCFTYYSDLKRCETTSVNLTNTKCVDHGNQTWEDANQAFIATALLLKVVRLVIDVRQF